MPNKKPMRTQARKIPHVYPIRVILKHYEGPIRAFGRKAAFVILVIASTFLAEPERQERTPQSYPTSHDLEAIADTSIYDTTVWRNPFYQGAVPEKEWFPEGQKRAPTCLKDVEVTWKERCWTPHKYMKPPCKPLGSVWQMGDVCLVPVFKQPKKNDGTTYPQE